MEIFNANDFSIRRVKDIYFSINERLFVPDPNKNIKIELSQTIGFNLELNLVNFTLHVFYHYPETPNEILVEIKVENIFQINDLKTFQLENKLIVLPEQVITSMVSMALSHCRALMLKNTAGTVFQDLIMPVSNAPEIAKHFYPYMFNENATVIQTTKKDGLSTTTTTTTSGALIAALQRKKPTPRRKVFK